MKKILMMLPVLVTLGACMTQVNMNPDKIFFTGRSDTGYVQNISVDETRPYGDELKQITIQGMSNVDSNIYYSVVWFDRSGMKINTTLSKSTLEHLRKNQPFYWTAVAPSQKAVSYKVYISDRAI